MILNTNKIMGMRHAWIVFFCLVTGSVCAQYVQINSDHIEIKYDKDFNRDIQWLDVSGNSLTYFDTNVQQGIVIDGIACRTFAIDDSSLTQDQVNHEEFGICQEKIHLF